MVKGSSVKTQNLVVPPKAVSPTGLSEKISDYRLLLPLSNAKNI